MDRSGGGVWSIGEIGRRAPGGLLRGLQGLRGILRMEVHGIPAQMHSVGFWKGGSRVVREPVRHSGDLGSVPVIAGRVRLPRELGPGCHTSSWCAEWILSAKRRRPLRGDFVLKAPGNDAGSHAGHSRGAAGISGNLDSKASGIGTLCCVKVAFLRAFHSLPVMVPIARGGGPPSERMRAQGTFPWIVN